MWLLESGACASLCKLLTIPTQQGDLAGGRLTLQQRRRTEFVAAALQHHVQEERDARLERLWLSTLTPTLSKGATSFWRV